MIGAAGSIRLSSGFRGKTDMQPAVESVSVWNIIVVLLVPIVGIGFGILWRIMDGVEKRQAKALGDATDDWRRENERLWTQLNAQRDQFAAYAIDAERRYINQQAMDAMKKEIFGRFDRLERHFDKLIGVQPDRD